MAWVFPRAHSRSCREPRRAAKVVQRWCARFGLQVVGWLYRFRCRIRFSPNSIRPVSFAHKPARWVSVAALVCILFLLAGGTAEAAHFCGIAVPSSSDSAQLRPTSPATTLCLICLMAQTAVAGAVLLVLFPLQVCKRPMPLRRVRQQSFLGIFHLYVRPPPSL